jgi:hypothetical protein
VAELLSIYALSVLHEPHPGCGETLVGCCRCLAPHSPSKFLLLLCFWVLTSFDSIFILAFGVDCLQMSGSSIHDKVWTADLAECTGFHESDLRLVVLELRSLHWNASTAAPVQLLRYFSSDSRHRVTEIIALKLRHLSFYMQDPDNLEAAIN